MSRASYFNSTLLSLTQEILSIVLTFFFSLQMEQKPVPLLSAPVSDSMRSKISEAREARDCG